MACIGILFGNTDSIVENRLVIDNMVSRQHQHQRVVTISHSLKSRERDGRGGIATDGLKDDVIRQFVQLAQLFCHQEAMLFVTDNHRLMNFKARESGDGFLQHGIPPVQTKELFRVKLAGHRPETTAGTTSHYHRK